MRRFWTGVAGAAVVFAATAQVGAETCDLELKRLESRAPTASTLFLRYTQPQYFFTQTGRPGLVVPTRSGEANFSDVVKKEPVDYTSKHPFRGVAKLGTRQYGFVFDSAPREKDEDAEGADKDESPSAKLQHYTRLYFDTNHNGDLTDDPVIESETPARRGGILSSARNYANYTFPRVDVTSEADGSKYEYSFFFSVYETAQRDYQYVRASLNAAAYRDGEITLDGKSKRIVLVDFNSNGRFDDVTAIDESVKPPDGSVYPSTGDMLFVDPNPRPTAQLYGYDATASDEQHYVAKLINIDGKFYDVEISATGDKLSLTAASAKIGYVTNPSKGYRAVVYSDKGFLKVCGGESDTAPLPEGDWKLLAYTIDQTGAPDDAAAKPKEGQKSLLQALVDAITPSARVSRPASTTVSARAKADYSVVKVRAGETVSMPFGPPYKPVVSAAHQSGASSASLGMSLVGSGGELCSNLLVNGRRPPDPKFTITTSDGEEVQSGKFEYG